MLLVWLSNSALIAYKFSIFYFEYPSYLFAFSNLNCHSILFLFASNSNKLIVSANSLEFAFYYCQPLLDFYRSAFNFDNYSLIEYYPWLFLFLLSANSFVKVRIFSSLYFSYVLRSFSWFFKSVLYLVAFSLCLFIFSIWFFNDSFWLS